MEYTINVTSDYLGLPVRAAQEKELLEIFQGENRVYEFQVPVCKEEAIYDYYAYLPVKELQGKSLTLKGDMGEAFFAHIMQTNDPVQEQKTKPLLHFTADRGWINDPNGLVFHDGVYHLYFQYNPLDTQWENMSWGHAVSTDLLSFRQTDTVLYPDQYGTVYSGCGLVNERGLLGLPKDALVFYYTAAGGMNKWSEGKPFEQRIAVSTDGGATLERLPKEAVGAIGRDSRDPQVFWHEQSQGYVTALWLKDDEIGFFRSGDLQNWEMASRISLPGAFECPNLFCLQNEGKEKWIVISAEGFYYPGQFDGYRFTPDGAQKRAYLTGLPYAAQIYSGVKDRTILVPWLRTKNEGKLYTGMMGLPRQLQLTTRDGEDRLQLLPAAEYEQSKQEVAAFDVQGEDAVIEVTEEAVTELELTLTEETDVTIEFFHQRLVIQKDVVLFGWEKTGLTEKLEEVHLLIDRQVVELYGNQGTLNAYYETGSDELTGRIVVKGCKGTVKAYKWRHQGGL